MIYRLSNDSHSPQKVLFKYNVNKSLLNGTHHHIHGSALEQHEYYDQATKWIKIISPNSNQERVEIASLSIILCEAWLINSQLWEMLNQLWMFDGQ